MNPAEDYILKQANPYKMILLHLQAVIESVIPELDLKFKYGLPFYYFNGKPFCYMNVSRKKGYVDLGFAKGNLITVWTDYHVIENRKKMISLRYFTMDEIREDILLDVLKDARSLY